MVNQIISSNQLITPNLNSIVQNLSTTLQAIQPSDNQNTRLITYALVGTVIAGLVVYHYIKNQESN